MGWAKEMMKGGKKDMTEQKECDWEEFLTADEYSKEQIKQVISSLKKELDKFESKWRKKHMKDKYVSIPENLWDDLELIFKKFGVVENEKK